ncbi:MAG: hypothetical protein BCV62_20860 [Pseudomonas sp. K35]|nr:MAG: hypothetical protein BCV62_20860 [Pseudomonas sp. K35]
MIRVELDKARVQCADPRGGERVEHVRAVKGDQSNAFFDFYEQGFECHFSILWAGARAGLVSDFT